MQVLPSILFPPVPIFHIAHGLNHIQDRLPVTPGEAICHHSSQARALGGSRDGTWGNAALASGQLPIVPQKYTLLVCFWHSATLSGPALLILGIVVRKDSIDEFL